MLTGSTDPDPPYSVYPHAVPDRIRGNSWLRGSSTGHDCGRRRRPRRPAWLPALTKLHWGPQRCIPGRCWAGHILSSSSHPLTPRTTQPRDPRSTGAHKIEAGCPEQFNKKPRDVNNRWWSSDVEEGGGDERAPDRRGVDRHDSRVHGLRRPAVLLQGTIPQANSAGRLRDLGVVG